MADDNQAAANSINRVNFRKSVPRNGNKCQ